MPAVQETVEKVRRIDVDQYKYGFVTDIESEKAPKGLSEDTVRFISAKKGEPQWMLDWRLEAYKRWLTMTDDTIQNTPVAEKPPENAAVTGSPALPQDELNKLTDDIVAALKTVYDPEIPADIYELGLIYKIDIGDDRGVKIDMHCFPHETAFDRRRQLSDLEYLAGSKAAATSLAEQYVGLPLD